MKASLIISVYKDTEALKAIFKSLALQSEKAFEVIIAQDADDNCFHSLVVSYQNQGLSIQYIQQEDNGFQKNKILNKAILSSQSDKLIFIDGDCVLHPQFITEHLKKLQRGIFCAGKRVNSDAKTSKLIRSGKIIVPSIWTLIKNKADRIEEAFTFLALLKGNKDVKLLGCNMSFHKSDLLKINGFNEDYTTAGYGEDTDIEFRALKAGIKKQSVRYRAIQYHLHHQRPERAEQSQIGQAVFEQTKQRTDFRCKNGIEKLEH